VLRNLGDIVSGKKTSAFALTEPDAWVIKALAVRHGDEFVISGQKMFITNGAIADLVTVIALTDPEKRARESILCSFLDQLQPSPCRGPHPGHPEPPVLKQRRALKPRIWNGATAQIFSLQEFSSKMAG